MKMSMVNVKLKLFATLREDRFDIADREVKSGTSINDIMNELNLAEEDVAIIFVNNRHADPEYIIHNQDTIAFFPPIGGG
jgi:molybdopterin converting factor small subunit